MRKVDTSCAITRTTSPYLESVLGHAFPVLDHGFIRCIDFMGNDDAIVQAARVSYGKGTKTTQDDRGLIRYLMQHWHSTPFEMCLDGDTRIPTFPCKGAKVKHYTIREIADAFSRKGKDTAWVKLLKIRTVNPQTGVVTATKIKNAWSTGVKKVFKITVEDPYNRNITVTSNHPILTPNGFKTLDQGLSVGDDIMLNGIAALSEDLVAEIHRRRDNGESISTVAKALGIGQSTVFKYSKFRVPTKTGFLKKPVGTHSDPRSIARRTISLGKCSVSGCDEQARDRHHIDENPHNNDPENLVGLCPKHHRHTHTRSVLKKVFAAKIVKIEELEEREVFDLEVVDDNHTFVAEGIVVHNCEIKLHVKLPVFVARQWIRHRTANVNEYSARYSILDREFYIPKLEHMAKQSTTNNQGRGEVLDPVQAAELLAILKEDANANYNNYEYMIDEDRGGGLARELARMNLPANIYTQWYWKTDLHNLFHFLRLRADHHAQYEIRVYAELICDLVSRWVPYAYEAFQDYRMNAVNFSAAEMQFLRRMVSQEAKEQFWHDPNSFGLTEDANNMLKPREAREFLAKLKE